MITITSLFSGSNGNSTLIQSETTSILIDAGRNCKAIVEALDSVNVSLCDIKAIFITHEHTDHIGALDVICHKNPIPIHITEPSAEYPPFRKSKYAFDCSVIHDENGYSEKVGDIIVTAFPLPHDSNAHMGYKLETQDGDSAAVCTDMGYVTVGCVENILGVRQALIEANHDEQMLKQGPYPYMLKKRILSKYGHLSNDNSAKLIVHLAKNGTEKVMLGHLSETNNTPEIAENCVRNALDAEGYTSFELKVAPRFMPKTL